MKKQKKVNEQELRGITKGRKMKVIDKLKNMDAHELSRWICSEIMNDDCDACPLTRKCHYKDNPIEKILDKEIPEIMKKTHICVTCEKVIDPNCKGNGKESCLNYEPRKTQRN